MKFIVKEFVDSFRNKDAYTRVEKGSLLFYLVLTLLSFGFLAFFSYYTSPLSSCDNGYDAAFFRLVGQGMTKGYLPYRDFFDMKGPYLFLIEYVGQVLSYGRLGIFIIQWVNLFTVLVIMCKIMERFNITGRYLQFGLLLPLLFIAGFTFEGGNLTEEFSLIPLLSCLYLCLLYFDHCTDQTDFYEHRIYQVIGVWFGICFGFLVLIRITNAALLGAMCLTILLNEIVSCKYNNLNCLFKYFLLGVFISVCPIILYFALQGLLREMLEAVFVLGVRYSAEKSFFHHIEEIVIGKRNSLLLLCIVPCYIPFLVNWRSWRERFLVLTGSLLTFFAIASGNNYTHYYTLTIPLLLLAEVAVVESIGSKKGLKEVLAIIVIAVMFIQQSSILSEYWGRAYSHLFYQNAYKMGEQVRDISSRIPAKDRNFVFCYNVHPNWYTYADLFPCFKYCGWQNHYIRLMPEIYNALENSFKHQPPVYLVLPKANGNLPLFLKEMLKTDYKQVYANQSYRLLLRKRKINYR